MPEAVGLGGRWALVAAAVLVLVPAVALVPRGRRVRRRARIVDARLTELRQTLDERHLRLAERFFARFAGWAVFVGRLLPVVRTYISFPAGLARMQIAWFTALTTVGCVIWLGALSYAGYRLGERWQDVEHILGPFTIPFGLLVLAAIVGAYIWGRRWMDRRPADEVL